MVVPVSTLQPALQPPTPSHPPMSAKPVTPVVLIVKEIRITVHHVLEAFLYLTTSAMSTALETTSNLEGCVSCVITNANYAKPPLLIVQLVLKTELMNPTLMAVLVLTLQPALQPPTPSHPPMSAKPVTPVAMIVKEIRITVHHVLEAFLYLTTFVM